MLITAAAINDPGTPCVIDRPGRYRLAESIDWTPRDAAARAISIAADDVSLDLGGHTLRATGRPAERVAQVGIWAEGRRRITIRNGAVRGVHGVGVALKDCHDVELDRLAALECGGQGAIDTSFLDRNGGIFVMGTRHGEAIATARGIRVLGCACTDNRSGLDRVVTLGALVLFCADVLVRDSTFDRTGNPSREPTGVQFNVVGLDIVQCRDVLVADCAAHDNHSGGEPAGFFGWGERIAFQRCHAHRNRTATGQRACGFNVSATRALSLHDCTAQGNRNDNPAAPDDAIQDFAAAGFRIGRDVGGAVLRRCVATDNTAASVRCPGTGFAVNRSHGVVLDECTGDVRDDGGGAWAAEPQAAT